MELNDQQKYFKNGIASYKYKNTEVFSRFYKTLESLYHHEGEADSDFHWISKYQNTLDLRPTAFQYDESLIDILFDNDIPEIMANLIGEDITLSHVQIRKSSAGPGYMPWHRDTYFIDDRVVGQIPPTHKLIYYPKFDGMIDETKLCFVEGTHNCLFTNQPSSSFLMPGFTEHDRQIAQMFNIRNLKPSNREFIIFNTAMIHGTQEEKCPMGSLRIIYSFNKKCQFDSLWGNSENNVKLNKLYEERVQ